MAFGAAMIGIDQGVGMPAFWTWGEGPLTIVLGAVTLAIARRVV